MPPAPRREVVRRNSERFTVLPATGRSGKAPAWPLANPKGGRPAGEARLWAQLWKMPQAVVWEEQRLERVVARYCRLAIQAELPTAAAGLAGEVRQLEDRLLLNPDKLRRAYYVIESTAPMVRGDRSRRPARRRLTVVA